MKWAALAVAVLWSGCQQPICITDSGTFVMGIWPHGDESALSVFQCARLNSIEIEINSRVEGHPLGGYSVWFREERSWEDEWGRTTDGEVWRIGGWTDCREKKMLLGNLPSVYPHELIHVKQNCRTHPELNPYNEPFLPGHEDWFVLGYFKVVEDVTNKIP